MFRSVLRSFDLRGQIHAYAHAMQTTSFKQRSMRLWNRSRCNISGVNFWHAGSSSPAPPVVSLLFTVAHSDRSRASDELVLSVAVFVAAASPPLVSAGRLFAESLPHASGVTPFIRQGIRHAVGVFITVRHLLRDVVSPEPIQPRQTGLWQPRGGLLRPLLCKLGTWPCLEFHEHRPDKACHFNGIHVKRF